LVQWLICGQISDNPMAHAKKKTTKLPPPPKPRPKKIMGKKRKK